MILNGAILIIFHQKKNVNNLKSQSNPVTFLLSRFFHFFPTNLTKTVYCIANSKIKFFFFSLTTNPPQNTVLHYYCFGEFQSCAKNNINDNNGGNGNNNNNIYTIIVVVIIT